MPARHAIKQYQPNAHYHIFNRGVDKRTIYQDEQDYKVFLSYLKLYLSPPLQGSSLKIPPTRQLKNYASDITLLSYCLMPNHFHLLVHQTPQHAINHFMRSISTKYSMYFNRKYQRHGHLFQGTYKAVKVTTDAQLLQVSKYIHRNPINRTEGKNLISYPYSSYPNYLGLYQQIWLSPREILGYFSSTNPSQDYQTFTEDSEPDLSQVTTFKDNP